MKSKLAALGAALALVAGGLVFTAPAQAASTYPLILKVGSKSKTSITYKVAGKNYIVKPGKTTTVKLPSSKSYNVEAVFGGKKCKANIDNVEYIGDRIVTSFKGSQNIQVTKKTSYLNKNLTKATMNYTTKECK